MNGILLNAHGFRSQDMVKGGDRSEQTKYGRGVFDDPV